MANRIVRSAASIVTAEDDARLIKQIFADGLFNITFDAYVVSGGTIRIPYLYGVLQGRDFHLDAHSITVPLGDNKKGSIYVVIDLSKQPDDRVEVVGYLDEVHTEVTYEDLNSGGTIAEMKIASYTATNTAATDLITTEYPKPTSMCSVHDGILYFQPRPLSVAVNDDMLCLEWFGRDY